MPSLVSPTLSAFGTAPQPTLPLTGGRSLRPWREADAAAVLEVYRDPAVQRWHMRTFATEDEAREKVAGWLSGWADEREACWAVVDPAGTVLGRAAVKVRDPAGVGEIAYWTCPAARGLGVAPAAVRAVSAWAFDAGFHRLELVHSVHNAPSCRVAQKAGLAVEGVRYGSVLHADGWHDMHLHARLAGS